MKQISCATLLCTLFLAGCSTYNEIFDCEPGKGVGCKSLSQVNRMVDEGTLPIEGEGKTVDPTALVTSPKQLRVWVAGHTDMDGITHEPNYAN